jgi:PIN domain nuclease of toxin-antitoxin system
MRYIIDTNILIRYSSDAYYEDLSKSIIQILADPENRIYVSAMSLQEIFMLLQAKKINVKKWKYAQGVFNVIEEELGFIVNYVKKEHLLTFAKLEPVKDHNDPVDRMIIAQAITEQMPLISSDARMKYYRKQKLDFIFNEK